MNIIDIKRKLLVKYPFFGNVVANVTYKESKKIPTAATDGKIIIYNQDFLDSLDSKEQLFTIAHEVCHIAFDHPNRGKGKIPLYWNIAADAVINQLLIQDGLSIVAGAVNIEDAINYNVEEYYEKLVKKHNSQQSENNSSTSKDNQESKNQQSGNNSSTLEDNEESKNQQKGNNSSTSEDNEESKNQQSGNNSSDSKNNEESKDQQNGNGSSTSEDNEENKNQQNGNGSSTSEDNEENTNQQSENDTNTSEDSCLENEYQVGHDTHEYWGKNLEDELEDSPKDKNEEQIQQNIDKISKMGEQNAFAENRKEKQKILERFSQELAKDSLSGKETNEELRKIGNIGEYKPLIDWRYLLKEAIKYEIDWSYQNATVENGVITPHLEEQLYSETEIVLDTSGSVDKELLKSFLKECKNIWKVSRLKVGCFDVKFYGFQEINYVDDIDNLILTGGGGTDFNVAVHAFSTRVENKIIFTDGGQGDEDAPKDYLDAIWLVYGKNKIHPKGGKVIYISEQDLINLKTKYSTNLTLKRK